MIQTLKLGMGVLLGLEQSTSLQRNFLGSVPGGKSDRGCEVT